MCPAGNNIKDEDNSPKILNDKNHLVSSQKFIQVIRIVRYINGINITTGTAGNVIMVTMIIIT